jgi:cellobiose-specific phosphotransferase system component IIC
MLPYSFAGLVVGVGAFVLVQPPGPLITRFAASFIDGFAVMAAVLVVLLTIDLARRRNVPIAVALPIAFALFTLLLPLRQATSLPAFAHALRSGGLFLAMGAALITVTALRYANARFGPLGLGLASGALLGAGVALQVLGISPSAGLNALMAPLGTLGDSLGALLTIMLIQQLLWLVGVHGSAMLAPVVLPVYLSLQAENTAALAHGEPLPHIVVTSLFLFVTPGGAGATLPLVVLLLRSRVQRLRTLAYAALVPAVFNTNEPVTFGLPLAFNPQLAVPFVLVPLLLSVTTYSAIAWGWVDRPAIYVFSWVPLPLSVILATKDWRAGVLAVVNLLIAFLFYFPFVRRYERREAQRERTASEAV